MKRFFTSLLITLTTLTMMAQGWPKEYEGVMLQGFYWNSFADTNWANLESQADELSKFFDLIWVPNSAYANDLSNNMGYHPVYWFDHKSAFGTEAQLRSMITTFKSKGTGIIEDVVINHRSSVDANWLNFAKEKYKGVDYQLTAADICSDDESKNSGFNPTGNADTGRPWGGSRDLDHTSANVKKNVNAYLDCLLNDLGYVGFRYDFVAGYGAQYVGDYNNTAKTANPNFNYSVGEYWTDEGNGAIINWIEGTKVNGIIQSAAFDFTMKWNINSVFANATNWSQLNNAALSNNPDYARYAVTFVDNHDTGPGADNPSGPLYANIEAANAFILTMPGTPCVWLKHWQSFKVAIKKQILVRKAAGIHNQSEIVTKTASSNGYVLNVSGKNGNVLLLLGSATTSTDGYKLALEGTNYKMYVSNNVDISALDDVKEDEFTAPDFCVVNEGETCAFFEAPTSYSNVKCWVWNSNCNFTTGSWPGSACTIVGTNNGKNVWKWTWNGKCYKPSSTQEIARNGDPRYIIFNGTGFSQTGDLDFANGGYYNQAGACQGIVTDIEAIRTTPSTKDNVIYDLQGRKVSKEQLKKGLYIVNGKKVVTK